MGNSRVVSAISAVILLWIFWPIISSLHIILSTIVFLPVSILIFLLGTVGESILFLVSLGSFLWLTRDAFVKIVTEQNISHGMLSAEEAGVTEEVVGYENNLESEIMLRNEMPSEEIGTEINEDKCNLEAGTKEDGDDEYDEKEANVSNGNQMEEKFEIGSDGTMTAVETEHPADLALAKSLATQSLCEDIFAGDSQDKNEMPVAPSAC